MPKKVDLAQLVCEFAKEKGYVMVHDEYDTYRDYRHELVINKIRYLKMTFAKWLDPLGATNLLASIRKNPLHNWYESKRLHEVADVKRIIIMGDWIIFSFPPLASTQMVNAHEPDSFDKLGECLSA